MSVSLRPGGCCSGSPAPPPGSTVIPALPNVSSFPFLPRIPSETRLCAGDSPADFFFVSLTLQFFGFFLNPPRCAGSPPPPPSWLMHASSIIDGSLWLTARSEVNRRCAAASQPALRCDAAAEGSEFWRFWEFGGLAVWGLGSLGVWGFGSLGVCETCVICRL